MNFQSSCLNTIAQKNYDYYDYIGIQLDRKDRVTRHAVSRTTNQSIANNNIGLLGKNHTVSGN